MDVYSVTVSIKDCSNCGTTGSQYVKITGTLEETTEQRCEANFNLIGQDVTCIIQSEENIGDYRCLIWRNGANDGWDIIQVIQRGRLILWIVGMMMMKF